MALPSPTLYRFTFAGSIAWWKVAPIGECTLGRNCAVLVAWQCLGQARIYTGMLTSKGWGAFTRRGALLAHHAGLVAH